VGLLGFRFCSVLIGQCIKNRHNPFASLDLRTRDGIAQFHLIKLKYGLVDERMSSRQNVQTFTSRLELYSTTTSRKRLVIGGSLCKNLGLAGNRS